MEELSIFMIAVLFVGVVVLFVRDYDDRAENEIFREKFSGFIDEVNAGMNISLHLERIPQSDAAGDAAPSEIKVPLKTVLDVVLKRLGVSLVYREVKELVFVPIGEEKETKKKKAA
jgi:hypothetical protein